MPTTTLIDWLIHKPVSVEITPQQSQQLTPGDMVIYTDSDSKSQAGEYLGYDAGQGKRGTFVKAFDIDQQQNFEAYQHKASQLFTLFDKEFGEAFPTSKTLCARMSHTGHQIYFYFYSDTRYNFAEFVKAFRSKVRMRFFLYQVGPRDRVRLHPDRHTRFDASGLPLMYNIFKHPLPNVLGEAVTDQGLTGRDSETLKDWSGKYDHTLSFEHDRYKQEAKQFPARGDRVDWYGKTMKCMGCNMLTQEIKLRGKTDENNERFGGERKVVTLDEYTTCIHHQVQ